MAMRPFLFLAILWLCVGPLTLGPVPAKANTQAPQDAAEFLVNLGERAVDELSDESLDEAERERRFRKLFHESIDIEAIGRFVLGRYWRRASEQERRDFLKVFEDATVQRFLPMFADYSGETFTISSQRRDSNDPRHVFVTSTINLSSGEPVAVEWRVLEEGSTYRILDITAEGVSMAITLRQEYSSVIRQSGVGGLVELLRKKVESGAFAPAQASTQ